MSAIVPPKPLSSTSDTVTLDRKEWTALVEHLEEIEDQVALDLHTARVATLGADAVRAEAVTAEEALRILDGTSPITLWRERAGLTRRRLRRRRRSARAT